MTLSNIRFALCFGLFACAPLVMAQTPQVNAYFGAGTATDSSNGQSINPLGLGFFNTPKLTGTFLDAGGSFMLTPHYGAGVDLSWRAAQGDYAGVNYRPFFYDFNGIWQPVKTKRIVPEIQAGIGGVRIGFSASQASCDQLIGCQSVSLGTESSSHFQTHFGAAVRFYATDHIFIRPAVDVHWVDNFFQFGSNWVPEYTVGLGYSFGGQ
jgi:hypothetical protein